VITEVLHPKAKVRRDALRAAGLCINGGPRSKVVHGPVVSGGRCQRCEDVKSGKARTL
jgi:hypothetical protein